MKVFVLENGSYSDTHIVGVFSSQENADLAARIFRDEASITEWDVDNSAELMRRGCIPYFVRLDRENGNTLDCSEMTSSYGAFSDAVGEDINKNVYTHAWAESRDGAVKIASERRRAFLALPEKVDAVDPQDRTTRA